MANRPAAPWLLRCPWCPYNLLVHGRGQRGRDEGAGVEAANVMTAHAANVHGRTWEEVLAATPSEAIGSRNADELERNAPHLLAPAAPLEGGGSDAA